MITRRTFSKLLSLPAVLFVVPELAIAKPRAYTYGHYALIAVSAKRIDIRHPVFHRVSNDKLRDVLAGASIKADGQYWFKVLAIDAFDFPNSYEVHNFRVTGGASLMFSASYCAIFNGGNFIEVMKNRGNTYMSAPADIHLNKYPRMCAQTDFETGERSLVLLS